MPRTSFLDVSKLADPLAQYNFDLFIPVFPGVPNVDVRDFRTKIMTTAIPGRTIEPIQVDLHGVTIEYAGRVQYARTLPFEMLETRDLKSRQVLRRWHQFTRNNSSLGAFLNEYSTTADIILYDDHDNIVQTTRLYKCWLESFDDASVDGSSSAAVTISGTLKYFYWEDVS